MNQFNEANSVRDFVRDIIDSFAVDVQFVPGRELPRAAGSVLLEGEVRDALARLNPEIRADRTLADEILYRLNSIILTARGIPNPVAVNEEFAEWLSGQKTMPFGPNGEHVPVRLIDLDGTEPSANQWMISTEVTFIQGRLQRRFDLVLWCNGFPLVVGEAKSPVRPAYTWIDAAAQINEDYEKNVPVFFVPNVLSFATEGKELRYGSVGMPVELWGPWREEGSSVTSGLAAVREAVNGLLHPSAILDFLRFFTVFATDNQHRKIKIIARYQQFQATNLIVERVLHGEVKRGLIWHFQGSGKSLLMVFTTRKLRAAAGLSNPTVLIVVDRIDLDTQITGTFTAADVPNLVSTEKRRELQDLLAAGTRKVIITTIHKFAEAPGVLDSRNNIIVLVDEAHRTQEGDLGRAMRQALPNAFLFGLTGTPINRRDRNTFASFGWRHDEGGFLSRYSMEDSIRDGATLKLHFEPRLSEIHIDEEGVDTAFEELSQEHDLTDEDKIQLSDRAVSIRELIKSESRIRNIAADIAEHFQERVEPEGFKAQLVAYDKPTCIAYKAELDKHLPTELSTIVMSPDRDDPPDWKRWTPNRTDLEVITGRFNDPNDPLKIIIVTAKLLTGFDAPILYVQYLDKPIKAHTLLQAITRTNRIYPNKTHGLVVDYLGVFDTVAKALDYDESTVKQIITNLEELKAQLKPAIDAALVFFPGVDRTVGGYEGLVAAQEAIADDEMKDAFGYAYSAVSQLWEAISPDPMLTQYEQDYRWLSDVYQSVKPPNITGRLVWHTLGAKTLALINEHVQVEVPRTDLETIILDETVLKDLLDGKTDPAEIEKQITVRIARNFSNPVFQGLSRRLLELKERYSDAQQSSLDFLRGLLDLARDTVAAEKEAGQKPREEQGKAALTELFEALRGAGTPVIVENIVNRIDEVVRAVRFDGWQDHYDGDRLVRQALRRTLYIQFKIPDQDVFTKAHSYVREYY